MSCGNMSQSLNSSSLRFCLIWFLLLQSGGFVFRRKSQIVQHIQEDVTNKRKIICTILLFLIEKNFISDQMLLMEMLKY
jgi:hypothetical protein